MDIKKTIKDWMLPIAMVTGASIYLLYHVMPEPVHKAGPYLEGIVVQRKQREGQQEIDGEGHLVGRQRPAEILGHLRARLRGFQ